MKNAMNQCRKCERYYAIPPNVICEHCAKGCDHQFSVSPPSVEPQRKSSTEPVTVEIQLSGDKVQQVRNLIWSTLFKNNIDAHLSLAALALTIANIEENIGVKLCSVTK